MSEEYFKCFIVQVNAWSLWFDQFFDSFEYMITWLQNYRVENAVDLSRTVHNIRTTSATTIQEKRKTVDEILKIIKPFKNLRRLCHLFNRSTPFQIVIKGTMEDGVDSKKYIQDMKRLQPNNIFTVDRESTVVKQVPIKDRQNVYWSVVSEILQCDLQISYQRLGSFDQEEILYEGKDIPVNKSVLHGEFETQNAGTLLIKIINSGKASRTIWFQIKQNSLSKCHLFDGIFDLYYKKKCSEDDQAISEELLSEILDQKVFHFIDRLLEGNVSLQQMTELKNVFRNKNISVQEEVKKLFINQSVGKNISIQELETATGDKKIEQVCDMLQGYQYYSHINVIIDCIKKFDIIPKERHCDMFEQLKQLNNNESCTIKEISNAYKLFKEKCKHQHLQLIKATVECSIVVQKMKEFDLYSLHGQRRFQALRDHLTTSFQLQEKNNMILNSLIVTHSLCEPFVSEANTFEEFLDHLAQMPTFEENSLDHIRVVNDNIQIVSMWLSAEETTIFDNALVTMKHLYKTGVVHIRLRHLLDEKSDLEIDYSNNKNQDTTMNRANSNREDEQEANNNQDDTDEEYDDDDDNEEEFFKDNVKYTLTKTDIDDHKRQLTFCQVDLQEDMIDKKILLDEQLKLFKLIDEIFSLFIKLEMIGHPNYQLRDRHFKIYPRNNKIETILLNVRNDQDKYKAQLLNVVQSRRKKFDEVFQTLKIDYDTWANGRKKWEKKSQLLKLFSNRQVMIMIILLTTTTTKNQVKLQFINKWYSLKDTNNRNPNESIFNLSVHFLANYLRSLRMNDTDIDEEKIISLYKKYEIPQGASVDTYLGQLHHFLQELFPDKREPPKNRTTIESHQYIISLNPAGQTSKLFETVFDIETWCTLLNLFYDQL
ncbi:unnamed protein product, partial [Rotaria magnacalcarata]